MGVRLQKYGTKNEVRRMRDSGTVRTLGKKWLMPQTINSRLATCIATVTSGLRTQRRSECTTSRMASVWTSVVRSPTTLYVVAARLISGTSDDGTYFSSVCACANSDANLAETPAGAALLSARCAAAPTRTYAQPAALARL